MGKAEILKAGTAKQRDAGPTHYEADHAACQAGA